MLEHVLLQNESMNREIWSLVTDGLLEVQGFRKLADCFRGFYRIYPQFNIEYMTGVNM